MSLSKDVIDALEAEFEEARVKTKSISGRPDARYLESYDVINQANTIFGYGGWGTSIEDIDIREAGGKSLCIVTLQLSVEGCLPREDVGVVIAAQKQGKPVTPEALETAVKGAASDALKRAFRQFGKQFGNDLYAGGEANGGGRPTRGAKGQLPGKVSNDPVSQLWAYVRAQGIDKDHVDETLEKVGGDASKALILLREERGDL